MTDRKMSKREVLAQFNEEWRELVRRHPAMANDKPAARGSFAVLVDSLHREGRITDHVANTITYPSRFE